MSIKPLHDRVVVKPIEADEVSAGGIVIPDSAKEKSTKGEVVAIGAGKPLDNGSLRAPVVKVGDKVIYGQYAGSSYKSEASSTRCCAKTTSWPSSAEAVDGGSRKSRCGIGSVRPAQPVPHLLRNPR